MKESTLFEKQRRWITVSTIALCCSYWLWKTLLEIQDIPKTEGPPSDYLALYIIFIISLPATFTCIVYAVMLCKQKE